MSQVYEESTQGVASTPGEAAKVAKAEKPEATEAPAAAPRPQARFAPDTETGQVPLRTRPSVMRVWVAPWEDADGDLHEDAWIALRLDDGRWNIEHVHERIRDGYGAALVPPPVSAAPAAKPATPDHTVAKDVADVLPKGLVPAMKAEPVPFFEQP
jgi:conjugal transfer pilus assembly protein TraV